MGNNESIITHYVPDQLADEVDEWEKVHKIKLHWNNWFDVSFAPLFCYLRLDSDRPA
jgi:hypothetical protein